MSTKDFTEKEIEMLSKNKYVRKVSDRAITYTDEFKRVFVLAIESGKFPIEIFESHNFDIDVLGKNRINSASKRWRVLYRDKGICGLSDLRKIRSGRPKNKKQTVERLKAEINLLKAENEMLKKINLLERGLVKK